MVRAPDEHMFLLLWLIQEHLLTWKIDPHTGKQCSEESNEPHKGTTGESANTTSKM